MKCLLVPLLLFLLLSVLYGQNLKNGTVAVYELENENDATPAGLNLTNVSSVTFVAGHLSNCAHFVSVSGQRLTHADNAAYSFGTGSFTLSAWVKYTDVSTSRGVVQKGTIGPYYALMVASSVIRFQVGDGASHYANSDSSSNPGNDTWHLVVGVCDRTATTVQLYVDNVAMAVGGTAAVGNIDNTDTFGIGNFISNYFEGDIDQVGVWNRALTGSVAQGQQATGEIAELWNGGAGKSYGTWSSGATPTPTASPSATPTGTPSVNSQWFYLFP